MRTSKSQPLRGSAKRLVAFIKLTPCPAHWLATPPFYWMPGSYRVHTELPNHVPTHSYKVTGPKVVILEKFLCLIFNITGERK